MPDITMCDDKECPMHYTCYRFRAKPNKERQSWFKQSPRNDMECWEYWPLDMTEYTSN